MNLQQVADMAKKVATEHEAYEEAKEAKGRAEDELLALVVEAIKPALPAMSSRVQGCAGPITRGVLIESVLRLYLGEEGDWFRIVQSDVPYVMSAAEVLDLLDLGSIAGTLVQTLAAQLGSRDDATISIERETRQLLEVVARFTPPVRRRR